MTHKFYRNVQEIIVPGLYNAQYGYKKLLYSLVKPQTRWLELGCGHQLFPIWMGNSLFYQQELVNQSRSITGIDADLISLKKNQCIHRKVLGDIQNLCFKNSSFDLVTANMVVEHVRNPELLLLEVKRVLAPGGLFMFHTPNLRGYTTLIANNIPGIFKKKLIYFLQGRKDEDVFPAFYRLNTHKAVSKIASEVKFDIEEIQMLESSTQTFKLGPIVLVELAWIRMLRSFKLVKYYTNMIVMLRKY